MFIVFHFKMDDKRKECEIFRKIIEFSMFIVFHLKMEEK